MRSSRHLERKMESCLEPFLKTLSKRGGIDAKHFAEFLVHHPNLGDLVPR